MKYEYLMELCEASNALLLVIDLQGKIFQMAFNHDALKKTAGKVLRLAELLSVPVLVTEQYPAGLGPTDADLMELYDGLTTDKQLLAKNAFGCCGDADFLRTLGTSLAAIRQDRGPGDPDRPVDIIVCGIETHVCVQQTVLELLRRDHRVVVLADCTGGRSQQNHEIALERFRQCGAVISCFESLAFEWVRTKDHARFKAMSALVRE